jgi:L-ascorbate metabolism protein UlaG (beta-lactamase superfamily)
MILFGIMILIIILGIYFFVRSPPFGAAPARERLARIQRSPYYKKGQFHNLSPTPQLTEGASISGVLWEFLFDKTKEKIPRAPLPSDKTNLLHLDPIENILVWFGHSSYFMQIGGRSFLVDPVFCGHASPFPFITKSFKGTDVYKVSELPAIDYLFITHDHWDHLDYKTVTQLNPKVRKVITSLGVGAHLERWGFDKNKLEELDWNEKTILEKGFEVDATTARHFSGRGLKRNGTIWNSFVLKTPTKNIFIGGDSGYDKHFTEIGNQFGPFDLAILENGQYDKSWKYIHMMPEETVQASIDLKAKKLLPVHWAKFNLSVHAWNEPILRIIREATGKNVTILHPLIGQKVSLDKDEIFTRWWEDVQ